MQHTHAQADKARQTAAFIRNNPVGPGQAVNVAVELEICADTIDDLYGKAYFILPTPKGLFRRLLKGAS